ncbi:MAG: hypothetical protein IKC54_03600 [Clostridia bacterium]|nr:hypothetical protein [Clostridia bacterium]
MQTENIYNQKATFSINIAVAGLTEKICKNCAYFLAQKKWRGFDLSTFALFGFEMFWHSNRINRQILCG